MCGTLTFFNRGSPVSIVSFTHGIKHSLFFCLNRAELFANELFCVLQLK